MVNRNKAYRRWKGRAKYVSRINKNIYYWYIKDESCPNGWRKAKNWKELDSDPSSNIKFYKKTPKKWTYKCDQYNAKKVIKDLRREGKDISNNTLKENKYDSL